MADSVTSPLCGGCTYCCWAYGVKGVPLADGTAYDKLSMETCPHIEGDACRIYERRPEGCRELWCPYLSLEGAGSRIRNKYNGQVVRFRIHRPDQFRVVIEEALSPEIRGRVLPAVPVDVAVDKATALVRETGCIPVIHDGEWQLPMLNHSDPQAAMGAWRNCG